MLGDQGFGFLDICPIKFYQIESVSPLRLFELPLDQFEEFVKGFRLRCH